MFKITMTYNGKEIRDKSDIQDAINEIAAKGIEDSVRNKLSDLMTEIEAEGAEIKVDMDNGKIQILNVSDELGSKIRKALS